MPAVIETIYFEEGIAEHPVARRIRRRFAKARQIPIARYGEVFNRKAQNFRLQKIRPALILARKHNAHVLPAPSGYGVGAAQNFYFSHMLNCVYDCRYCFLQGMFRSANYVVFVNYEDFSRAIERTVEDASGADICFFSGYDCDSLALEPVTGFAEAMLELFERHPGAQLELRTKSTQTRSLLKRRTLDNVIVAFSFTPTPFFEALEHKVPSVPSRVLSMAELARRGWPIGLRFDPLIYDPGFREHYRLLFEQVFAALDGNAVHSVSLGPFRLPRPYYRTLERHYPDEPLFAGRLEERNNKISYPAEVESELLEFCFDELGRYVTQDRLFRCEF